MQEDDDLHGGGRKPEDFQKRHWPYRADDVMFTPRDHVLLRRLAQAHFRNKTQNELGISPVEAKRPKRKEVTR